MHSKSLEPSIETVSTDIGAWLDECACELSSSDWRTLLDTDGIPILDLVHSLLFFYLINQRTALTKGEQPGKAGSLSLFSRLFIFAFFFFFVLVILKYFLMLLLVVEESPLAPVAGGFSWVQSPPFPRTITRVDLNVDYFVNTTMVWSLV